LFCFYYHIIVVLVVHCDIYKSAYNIFLPNSSAPSFSFISLPPIKTSFNRSHFSIFIHEYIIFPPYLSSFTLSLCPLPSHWNQLPDRTYFTFLHFTFKKMHVCLKYSKFHYGISMYIGNISWNGSSLPFFFLS
jgi:hypothetical protein